MAKKKKKEANASEDEVIKEAETKDIAVEEEEAVEQTEDAEAIAPEAESADASTCEEEHKECQDKLLRLAAEFENYKKRMIREKQTALKYAEENILKDLLPTIDNLERAINQDEATQDVKNLLEGVQLTLKGLESTLSKYGLEPIKSVGEPFDPNLHEALVMEASDEIPAQNILREFEKGYHYKERLLRAAKVVVSKGQES